ncbi:hypothetical protein CR205_02410 [Alteribacter lacisalsi]|uniref:Uncharacterized protein n=1 Tax=Alteribacter lacisalsi TaxID=2045244 RepID=A0A2W0HBT6_9BACI|nr:hypothetical protein CR205_02410 [Alteribacter lacisalsi]
MALAYEQTARQLLTAAEQETLSEAAFITIHSVKAVLSHVVFGLVFISAGIYVLHAVGHFALAVL